MSEETCLDCDGGGWLHMGEPFEIEKCDSCGAFDSDDGAVVAHAKNCGCDWPPTDYPSALFSWVDYGIHWRLPPEMGVNYRLLQQLARDRENFRKNIDRMMGLVGGLIHGGIASTDKNKAGWLDDLLRQMRGAGGLLLNVNYLIKDGLWKDHWLLSPEEGTYDDKTGRWTAPKGESNGGHSSGRSPDPRDRPE